MSISIREGLTILGCAGGVGLGVGLALGRINPKVVGRLAQVILKPLTPCNATLRNRARLAENVAYLVKKHNSYIASTASMIAGSMKAYLDLEGALLTEKGMLDKVALMEAQLETQVGSLQDEIEDMRASQKLLLRRVDDAAVRIFQLEQENNDLKSKSPTLLK